MAERSPAPSYDDDEEDAMDISIDEDALMIFEDDEITSKHDEEILDNSPVHSNSCPLDLATDPQISIHDKDAQGVVVHHNKTDPDLDFITTQAEVNQLIKPSPPVKPVHSGRRFSATGLSGKLMRLLVPVTIPGGCVKIKHEEDTNLRAYYNDFYELSQNLTTDQAIWNKIRDNDFKEGEDRPELVEYYLPTIDQVVTLYKSLDLYEGNLVVPSLDNTNRKFRLESLLIRGVNGMNTSQVFMYLRAYSHLPVKLEWVNDVQCVAVFPNQYEAARCLLGLGKPISTLSPDPPPGLDDVTFEPMSEVPINWIEIPMPRSHTWRFTISTDFDPKPKPGFLLTVAKTTDKKQLHAEACSDYYRSHGNPNWKERPGLWTKTGYDQRMRKKQSVIALKRSPPPVSVTSPGPVVSRRVSVKSRLGVPSEGIQISLSPHEVELGEGSIAEGQSSLKLSRRSVTIKRRTDTNDHRGVITQPHKGGSRNGNSDYQAVRYSGTYRDEDDEYDDDEEDVSFHRAARRNRYDNDEEGSPVSRVPQKLSIHDRLGW